MDDFERELRAHRRWMIVTGWVLFLAFWLIALSVTLLTYKTTPSAAQVSVNGSVVGWLLWTANASVLPAVLSLHRQGGAE